MTPSHDTLVLLAKTLGLFWMMAFFMIVVALTYLPSRRTAYERAARSVLAAETRDARDRDHEP